MPKKPETAFSADRPFSFDEKDLAILHLLQENARITVKEIAQRIHLSTTPVHDRIKRLESEGIIKQYTTLLDPAKLKLGLTAICYVSLKEHSKAAGSRFIRSILAMPEVLECYNISGEFDFMLKVVTEDMNAYHQFHVNRLSSVENIAHVQSIFVIGVIKQTHHLLPATRRQSEKM